MAGVRRAACGRRGRRSRQAPYPPTARPADTAIPAHALNYTRLYPHTPLPMPARAGCEVPRVTDGPTALRGGTAVSGRAGPAARPDAALGGSLPAGHACRVAVPAGCCCALLCALVRSCALRVWHCVLCAIRYIVWCASLWRTRVCCVPATSRAPVRLVWHTTCMAYTRAPRCVAH